MSRKKSKKVYSVYTNINRETIYDGSILCPVCGRETSAYRVAVALEKNHKFSDFMGKCPICRK